ncbi:hypothetical protein [Nannocystis sp. SCPEA4]|uniref:hypothetical protein n=1 Tax=Nannocystis sp. SCPEA4 TaxID=2996787 RepID=UPI00226D6E43|nr:hypothetical protein [Nannocystis sp. SCPEA4]MCY1054950.1 hypothetical protein [Nannocystis sp. SCPEA4]
MGNTANQIKKAMEIDGSIAAAIVDSESGMTLATAGGGAAFDIEVAAAANTNVVQAKLKAMNALRLSDELEDILITLGKQYHIIRPLRRAPAVFYYIACDRNKTNLAMARRTLAEIEHATTL